MKLDAYHHIPLFSQVSDKSKTFLEEILVSLVFYEHIAIALLLLLTLLTTKFLVCSIQQEKFMYSMMVVKWILIWAITNVFWISPFIRTII